MPPVPRQNPLPLLCAILLAACAESTEVMQPSYSHDPFEQDLASLSWQARARTHVAANNLSPLLAGRIHAALAVAQYAGVMDASAHAGDANHSSGLGVGGRARFELERGAIAAASVEVLSFFFPSQRTSMEASFQTEAAAGPGGVHPQFQAGAAIGRAAGLSMVDRLKGDRFTAPWTGTAPTGPGYFIPNGPPAGASLPGAQTYFLTSAAQFHPPDPPAYGSAAFMADLNEVIQISMTRTPAQLATAIQWNYGNGTPTPPGYWNTVAGDLITEAGLGEAEATHITALMHAAMFDAVVGCWESKYSTWYIRPWQAAVALGLTPITTPIGQPNHPSYPSGHSCVSSAAGQVLTHFFPQYGALLNAQVVDAGLSRIYGGIHYRFDITAGQDLGRSVAQYAIQYDQTHGLLAAVR